MATRDPLQLLPEMWPFFSDFRTGMLEAGLDFVVTCTYRTQEDQEKLFEQGRTKPGQIVTWTRKSKHTERKAFDIAMIVNGKITWDTKEYLKAGEIGIKVGLQWGGSWARAKDYPHFEMKEA
jgi:peptidoglycan L-alanyl-D-glutamate endopeptidase CwlK